MSSFGSRVKERREQLGLSQDELANLLGYSSRSTISKIESDQRDITRGKVIEFAKVLKVSPAYLMGWAEEVFYESDIEAMNNTFSDYGLEIKLVNEEDPDWVVFYWNGHEFEWVPIPLEDLWDVHKDAAELEDQEISDELNYLYRKYRRSQDASPAKQIAIDPFIQHTVDNMRCLIDPAKKQIADYSDFIYSNEDNRLDTTPLIAEDYTELYTIGSAAAGAGAYNQGYDDGSYIRIHLSDTPEYDAIVDVRGDSMTPTINNGDVAFVDFSFDKKDGEIYIVQHDEETFIKRCFFEPDKLTMKSDNEAYKDIVFENGELELVRIIGVVTDWATPEK